MLIPKAKSKISKAWYMIETKIYCNKSASSKDHISGLVMKLLILLTFCIGFVACRDRLLVNYIHMTPLDSGPPQRPIIYRSAPTVPEKFLSEGEPKEKAGMK